MLNSHGNLLRLSLAICCVATALQAEITTAVVTAGSETAEESLLAALLTVELGKYPTFALLERENIRSVLDEQALVLSTGKAPEPNQYVKAGELIGADLFVILRQFQNEKRFFVHLIAVDTRCGIRIMDTARLMTESTDPEPVAADLARQVRRAAERMPDSLTDLLLVGVAAFRSTEMSSRWDWLSEVLPIHLTSHLASYPGVYVMERQQADILMEERTWSTKFPVRLQTSSLLINGSFRVADNDEIIVDCRLRNSAGESATLSVKGRAQDLPELCARLAANIVNSRKGTKAKTPLRNKNEAKILAAEALAYYGINDARRALPSAEAALAVAPHQPELKILLLRLIPSILKEGKTTSNQATHFLEQCQLINRAVALTKSLLVDPQASKAASIDLRPLGAPRNWYSFRIECMAFAAANQVFWSWPEVGWESVNKQKSGAELNEVRAAYRQLYKVLYMATSPEERLANERSRLLQMQVSTGDRWQCSAKEAQTFLLEVYNEYADFYRQEKISASEFFAGLTSSRAYRIMPMPGWPESEVEQRNACTELYRKLSVSDNTLLQIHAHQRLAELASRGKKFTEAKDNCSSLLRLVSSASGRNRRIGNLPNERLWSRLFSTLLSIQLAEEPGRSRGVQLDLLARAVSRVLAAEDVRAIVQLDGVIASTARLYQLNHEPAKAVAVLAETITRLEAATEADAGKKSSLVRVVQNLETRRANIADIYDIAAVEKMAEATFTWKTLIQSASLRKTLKFPVQEVRFQRICIMGSRLLVVCCCRHYDSNRRTRLRFGIIELQRETGQLLRSLWQKESLEESRHHDQYLLKYSRWGAEMAVKGDTVYLAVPDRGILVFDLATESVQRLSEETGFLSNRVHQLAFAGAKLYAHIGSVQANREGVAEYDPQTGLSRLLCSSIKRESENPLDGKAICGIAAAPAVERLVVLTSDRRSTPRNRLSLYSPEKGGTQTLPATLTADPSGFHSSGGTEWLDRRSNCMLMFRHALTLIDIENAQSLSLADASGKGFWSGIDLFNTKVVPAGKGLVAISRNDMLYYRFKHEKPEPLRGKIFPDGLKGAFCDAVPSEIGLYVSCASEIGCIAQIKGAPAFTDFKQAAEVQGKRLEEEL